MRSSTLGVGAAATSKLELHSDIVGCVLISTLLVNLVPLVHQQSSVIAGNSNLRVGKLYGELKDSLRGGKGGKLAVDTWRAQHWEALLESHDVVVEYWHVEIDIIS